MLVIQAMRYFIKVYGFKNRRIMELSVKDFKNQKKQIVKGIDASRKGSVDEPIINLVELINNHADYVTTSSCSGRVIMFVQNGSENGKQNCKWIYTSHVVIEPDILVAHANPQEGDIVLKFEPFILHVQCRTLESAKIMQRCALDCGFRYSGIVFGKHGKITLAVRSTHSLEVPICCNGNLFVSSEYLKFLGDKVNEKMEENQLRTSKFAETVEKIFIDQR